MHSLLFWPPEASALRRPGPNLKPGTVCVCGTVSESPLRVNPVNKIPISKSRLKLAILVEIAANPGRNR